MTLRPSVAITDVTFAFEIDVIAPALTKCEIVVQYNTFSNHWLYRRGVLEYLIYIVDVVNNVLYITPFTQYLMQNAVSFGTLA